MSLDLAAWEDVAPMRGLSPDDAFEAAMDALESEEPVTPTAAVRAAEAALAERWPRLGFPGDEQSPWSMGPEVADIAGPVLYLCLTYSGAERCYDDVVAILKWHELVCYDPQTEALA